MTYSVLAVEPECGRIGAAIASRFLAVGSYCLYLDPRHGGVVTQSIANPVLGHAGLAGLARGDAPEALTHDLLASDPDADHRQVHLMSMTGQGAAWTGPSCGSWAGHARSPLASFAGNLLTGPEVIAAMEHAWSRTGGKSLAHRLLSVLEAAGSAGGDRRGMQAAAIQVWSGEIYPELDLRVDDSAADPVAELRRLHERHHGADVQAVRAAMPHQTLSPAGPTYPGIGDLTPVHQQSDN